MSLFRNPMSKDTTIRQKVSFAIWILLSVFSVILSAKSLMSSFNTPEAAAYGISSAAICLADLALYWIKKSRMPGYMADRNSKFIGGVFIGLFSWTAILMTNTHYLFFKNYGDKLRRTELVTIQENFELTNNYAKQQVESFCEEYSRKIINEIDNLEREITNVYNPGHDTASDKILRRIEKLLGSKVDLPSNAPTSGRALVNYAKELAANIRSKKDENQLLCAQKMKSIDSLFNSSTAIQAVNSLNKIVDGFDSSSIGEKTAVLKTSFAVYNKIYKALSDIALSLGDDQLHLNIVKYQITTTPASIDLEDFSVAWGDFFKHPTWRFFVSLILAMIIDIGSFYFLYRGYLSDEDE